MRNVGVVVGYAVFLPFFLCGAIGGFITFCVVVGYTWSLDKLESAAEGCAP